MDAEVRDDVFACSALASQLRHPPVPSRRRYWGRQAGKLKVVRFRWTISTLPIQRIHEDIVYRKLPLLQSGGGDTSGSIEVLVFGASRRQATQARRTPHPGAG